MGDGPHERLIAGQVSGALLRIPHVGLDHDHNTPDVVLPRHVEGRVEPAQIAHSLSPGV